MSTFGTPSKKPGETTEITKKISEISETIPLTNEQVKEFKDVELSLNQISKLKEGKLTITELSKLKIDQLRSITTNFSNEKLLTQLDKGAEEAKKSVESAEDFVNESIKTVSNSKTGQKAKDAFIVAKEKAKEVGAGFSWKKLESMPLFGGFFKMLGEMFGWIKGLLGFGEKVKELKDKTEKILDTTTPEYKETLSQTQNTVISYLEKTTGKKFDESTKARLKTKLSPNIKGSYISTESFEKLTKKIKSGEKLGIEDLKDSRIILNIMKDPDFKEIGELLSQNINKKLFNFFKEKFEKSGVTIEGDNEGKLKKIIKSEFQNTTANKLVERAKQNGGEVHFNGLEGIQSVLGVGALIPNVIFEAYDQEILKAENLAIGLVESGKDTISIGLKAFDGQSIMPDLIGRMSWDDFDGKIGNIEPQKRILLERAFYAELGLVSSVLGTIGFYGTSSLVSIIEGTSNKVAGKNFSTPPVNKLKNTLNIISEGKGAWLQEIEGALKDTKKSYEIVKKLEAGNLSDSVKKTLQNDLAKISQRFQGKETGYKFLLDKKNISKIVKDMTPIQAFYFEKHLSQLKQITTTNINLGYSIINGTFTKEIYKAKQFLESFKMRYINGRAVLNLTDGLKGKEFTKAMGSLAPEMVKGLFKVAPILIVGGTIWNSAKEQEGEWYETLIMLNGFVGGMQLFQDTEVNYTEEGLQIKNPESFAGGIALIGMETVFFGKEVLQYTAKGQLLRAIPMATFNSFVRLPLDAVKGIGWAGVRGYETLKVAKSFLQKSPKKGKIGLGIALLLGAIVAVEYATADEIDSKQLEKDGLLKDGEPNIDFLKEKWPQIEKNKKEEIISLYSISMLEKSFKGKEDKFNFKLEDGEFKISIDNELENNKLLIENLLENVSRFLTNIDSNIKLRINFD